MTLNWKPSGWPLKTSPHSISSYHPLYTSSPTARQQSKDAGIYNPRPGQNIVQSIWTQATNLLSKGTTTTISWVPGHEDVPGNESADRLAGLATLHQPDTRCLSISKLRRLVRRRAIEEWQAAFLKTDQGTEYSGNPSLSLKPELRSAKRSVTTPLIHLRTGHGYFKAYYERFNIPLNNYRCNCGSPIQTRSHLLLHCPDFSETRRKLFSYNPTTPWTAHTLLHTEKGIKKVLEFIDTTKVATRGWFGHVRLQDADQQEDETTLTVGLGRLDLSKNSDKTSGVTTPDIENELIDE